MWDHIYLKIYDCLCISCQSKWHFLHETKKNKFIADIFSFNLNRLTIWIELCQAQVCCRLKSFIKNLWANIYTLHKRQQIIIIINMHICILGNRFSALYFWFSCWQYSLWHQKIWLLTPHDCLLRCILSCTT